MKVELAQFAGYPSGRLTIENPGHLLDPYEPSAWLGRKWYEHVGAFDFGALSAYLLRRFGLPNVFAFDEMKHGPTWGLQLLHGVVLVVEPRPIRGTMNFASCTGEEKSRLIRSMGAHRVFAIEALEGDVSIDFAALEKAVDKAFRDFTKPVRWRDMGVDAAGRPSDDDPAQYSGMANIVVHPGLRNHPGTFGVVDKDGTFKSMDDALRPVEKKAKP